MEEQKIEKTTIDSEVVVDCQVIQPALHYCEYNEPKTVCGVTFAPHKVKTIKNNSVSRRCIIEDSDIEITNMGEDLDTISCLPCKGWLKERLYHCPEHGFISGADVTFGEHCAYCGEAV